MPQSEKARQVLPPPPKLWKLSSDPKERVPLMVFGWPISVDNRREWANRFQIPTEVPQYNRLDNAWKHMGSLLPDKAKRAKLVRYNGGKGTVAMCIIIGSNKDERDLKRARNRTVISETSDVLQVDVEPQWLMVADQPDN
ncbi:hypothetical protein CPB84DRAFT_1965286 [Gymnopilus junonius]|uniref:Uncharacterized protein n=1 Tax=Gymnopilus junonius TaxID=109634 RepID=A0A9P5NF33_GYMJU|nr:hypothetical protein CPB84DRAFT_1965286 [Gymnopilus junonius]